MDRKRAEMLVSMNECDHTSPSLDAKKSAGHPNRLKHARIVQQSRPKQTIPSPFPEKKTGAKEL
jgi:hypothetical protein